MSNYNDVMRHIKDNEIPKLYLFFGEEAYLRAHCLERLQKHLIPLGAEGFNYHRLEGKGLSLRELYDTAEGVPFLAERKLVVVDDFDLMDIPTADRDGWVAFLSGIPESCCLVFAYVTIAYKPDGRSKIQAALNQHACIVEFKEQEDGQLISWVTRRFKAEGKEIDRSTCEYLIFRCGRNMTSLLGEIGKLSAYTDGKHITREGVDEVTEPILEAVSFDLTDAIADGNGRKAAKILQTLQWMREPPEALLGLVGKTMRGLYVAKLALDSRRTARDVMAVCGYRSAYPAEKLMRSAGKRPTDWYRTALFAVREADAMLKGEIEGERERVMEWLLAKVV
jgi:DNA polymerase-3 subunit delta